MHLCQVLQKACRCPGSEQLSTSTPKGVSPTAQKHRSPSITGPAQYKEGNVTGLPSVGNPTPHAWCRCCVLQGAPRGPGCPHQGPACRSTQAGPGGGRGKQSGCCTGCRDRLHAVQVNVTVQHMQPLQTLFAWQATVSMGKPGHWGGEGTCRRDLDLNPNSL